MDEKLKVIASASETAEKDEAVRYCHHQLTHNEIIL